eukprot:1160058-Pelagomonas_calceolata.AAC.13
MQLSHPRMQELGLESAALGGSGGGSVVASIVDELVKEGALAGTCFIHGVAANHAILCVRVLLLLCMAFIVADKLVKEEVLAHHTRGRHTCSSKLTGNAPVNSGNMQGALCSLKGGGVNWVPAVYSTAQRSAVRNFYEQNGWVGYDTAKRHDNRGVHASSRPLVLQRGEEVSMRPPGMTMRQLMPASFKYVSLAGHPSTFHPGAFYPGRPGRQHVGYRCVAHARRLPANVCLCMSHCWPSARHPLQRPFSKVVHRWSHRKHTAWAMYCSPDVACHLKITITLTSSHGSWQGL